MASALSHALAALSIGTCFYRPRVSKLAWVAGASCSVLPDIDVIGFRFGIPYGDFWGHRGFTHSLLFAALLSCAAVAIMCRKKVLGIGRFPLLVYLFLATASHGLLDAMTNGGLGGGVFLAVRQHAILFAVETNSCLANFPASLLQRARIRRSRKRTAVDLVAGNSIRRDRRRIQTNEPIRCESVD